ncbi:MAG: hypothetical protein KDD50_12175 [Bdellovibrionales bacterium]|nr:hypothetical protein [Bdellovibrionales bacterium]
MRQAILLQGESPLKSLLHSSIKCIGLLILVFFFINEKSFAYVDYHSRTFMRSYPFGGGVEFESGYNVLVWKRGVGSPSAMNPWYGFVRPSLQFATAGSFNEYSFKLDLFPISFLGLKFGTSDYQNFKNYSAYDCVNYQCLGHFRIQYAELNLIYGKGPYFGFFKAKQQNYTLLEMLTSNRAIEPSSALLLSAQGDMVYKYISGLGYRQSDRLAFTLLYLRAVVSDQKSETKLVNASYKWDEYQAGVSLGEFQSDLSSRGTTVVLQLGWNPKPSLELL